MIIRKKYLFYTLAITSSFIVALVTALDSIIGGKPLFKNDPWAFGFAIFFIGTLATLIISLILSIPTNGKSLGATIVDPSFKRLRMIQKSELKYHVVAGLMNAINTIGYCAVVSMIRDPSVILSFSQVVILYLLLMESITEKDIPTLPEVQSSVIVTFGAILASISLKSEIGLAALGVAFAIVFLVINPTWAVFSIYQRKLKLMKILNKSNDSINIRFWNVVFSCIFTTIIIFIFDVLSGEQHLVAGIAASLNLEYFILVGAIMSTTFFAYVFYIRSLGLGKASVNNAIRASTIIFAVPFSILIAMFPTNDPIMLLIKVIGMILIIMGIISFALTVVKAYIFITIKPGQSRRETMDKLWAIRGVTHVTATAGKYDFIVKVSTRTLMKGYERTIRKIEEIKEIKKYQWASVLKDWEDI